MRGKNVFCISFFAVLALFAGEREFIWPEGKMPDAQTSRQIAAMTDEAGKPGFDANAHRVAYIEWFEAPKPEVKKDVCMILISGGGYYNCCDVWLIAKWREALTAEGVQCVNFVYRTPRPDGLPIYKSAWEDGQRAVRMVRSEAAKRGFDPEKIGTVSMSAGSHLAVLLATSSQTPAYQRIDEIDDIPCHINWALVHAVAYATTDACEAGVPAPREGDAVDVALDPAFKFDAKTCPMWLAHGGKDPYTPMGSTLIYRKLRSMHVPAEVHLYPDKPHGAFGFERGIEFMRQMGYLGKLPEEVDLMKRMANVATNVVAKRENIWPEGKMPNASKNQCTPYIEWYVPTNLTTRSIQIIYSGGSYMGNGPDGFEVAPARKYLNDKGMAVVTMRYRTPRPKGLAKHTTAWQDLQRAIRIVRSEAKSRGLNPDSIGIMGSSAGGHLTLMGATSSLHKSYWPIDNIDNISCSVQWAVAIYPAYALTDGADQHNTTGGNDDSARLVRDFSFDLATPPMLFIHGDADGWAAMNSVKTWEQLRRMGIQGELHTLALRNHCFQRTAVPGTGSYTWLDRIWEFMTEKKVNK